MTPEELEALAGKIDDASGGLPWKAVYDPYQENSNSIEWGVVNASGRFVPMSVATANAIVTARNEAPTALLDAAQQIKALTDRIKCYEDMHNLIGLTNQSDYMRSNIHAALCVLDLLNLNTGDWHGMLMNWVTEKECHLTPNMTISHQLERAIKALENRKQ